MKTSLKLLLLALCIVFSFSATASNKTHLQAFNNSNDPNLFKVDFWINGVKWKSNTTYRNGTAWLHEGYGYKRVAVTYAGGNKNDTICSSYFYADSNKAYTIMLTGLTNTAQYLPNPNGRSLKARLIVNLYAKNTVPEPNSTLINFFNGVPDMPGLNLKDRWNRAPGFKIEDIRYADVSAYQTVNSTSVMLDLVPFINPNARLASFKLDTRGQENMALTIFSSGYNAPSFNKNGPNLELLILFPDGSSSPIPRATKGNIRIIHLSPDSAASKLTLFVNTAKKENKLEYLGAISLENLDAGQYSIGLGSENASSYIDTLTQYNFRLLPGDEISLLVVGVLSPSDSLTTPDGISTKLHVVTMDNASRINESEVASVQFQHGSPDLPMISFNSAKVVTQKGIVQSILKFNEFGAVKAFEAGTHFIHIRLPQEKYKWVRTFKFDATPFIGKHVVISILGYATASQRSNTGALSLAIIDDYGNVTVVAAEAYEEEEQNTTSINSGAGSITKIEANVFPNPAHNSFQIRIPQTVFSGLQSLQIVNMQGQLVRQLSVNELNENISIDCAGWNAGQYIILGQGLTNFSSRLIVY